MQWLLNIDWIIIGKIILVDILLGGDNALIIALACKNLPKDKRSQGVIWGTLGAIAIRVALIFFFLSLVKLPFLKLIGGLLLLWIGIKLLLPQDEEHHIKSGHSVWEAVKTIIVADLVMSLDNVLAITGAAESSHADHQIFYVMFGLIVSVPIIIWGSTLILKLIDRFKVIIVFGAGLLGWLAGGMMIGDVAVMNNLFDGSEAPIMWRLTAEVIGVFIVIVVGYAIARRYRKEKSNV